MNFSIKHIVIITAVVLIVGGILLYVLAGNPFTEEKRVSDITTADEQKEEQLSNIAECQDDASYEIVKGEFDPQIPGGTTSVEGDITTASFTLFGQQFDGVYLEVLPEEGSDITTEEFYDYYSGLARSGNTINRMDNSTLLFKLGTLDNANNLSSTASISQLALSRIKNSLDKDLQVKLQLNIPNHIGSGAPENFSFACSVRVAEN